MAMRSHLTRLATRVLSPKAFFSLIYRFNYWGGAYSRSGRGSEGAQAEQKVEFTSKLLEQLEVRNVLDVGCGDLYWMSRIVPRLSRYLGVDVVHALIAKNEEAYGSEHIRFLCADLTQGNHEDFKSISALGPWDLIMALDIFGHLLNREVDAMLDFVINHSGARYFMVTNSRDDHSRDFLVRPKTRHQSLDLEAHRLFIEKQPKRVMEIATLEPAEFFDVYALRGQ
jgi:cyclopropane fatty-acyl-phospholipid synthase-like methyltransferase